MRLYIVCAAFIAASGTVAAAETPEAAYAEFHRALMKDDVNAMASASTAAGGHRIKEEMFDARPTGFRLDQALSPGYRIVSKTVERDRAVLKLRATGGTLQPDRVMSGQVVLLKGAGGWKVDDMSWTPGDPGGVAESPARRVPPLPAAQLKDPEAVYAQFHRALIAGDLATLERHSTADYYSKDLASQAGRIRDAAWLFSPLYSVTGRMLSERRAVLEARGQAGPALGGGPTQGRIVLLKQGDEWRVDKVGWTVVQTEVSTPAQPPRPGIDTPMPVRSRPPPARAAGSGAAAGAPQQAQ